MKPQKLSSDLSNSGEEDGIDMREYANPSYHHTKSESFTAHKSLQALQQPETPPRGSHSSFNTNPKYNRDINSELERQANYQSHNSHLSKGSRFTKKSTQVTFKNPTSAMKED